MGWFILALGCGTLGLSAWVVREAFKRENATRRSEVLKIAAAFGVGGCLLFAFSAMYLFDIGANLTVSQLDTLTMATGALLMLVGLWLAFFIPRRMRVQYQSHHDVRSRHRFLIAVTITLEGFAVSFVAGGVLLILLGQQIFAFSIVVGIVAVVGVLVSMCAGVMAAFIGSKLATDAAIETWRQGSVRR